MRQEQHRLPTAIRRPDGEPFAFGGVGGLLKLVGADTRGQFAAAILPNIAPKTLGAPLHCHRNEDEYSYVLAGTLGALVGEEVMTAGRGTWIVKPRGQWHTFWNAGARPLSLIEIVAPAGFERYFREVTATGGHPAEIARINARYSIEMDLEGVPALCDRFGLATPAMLAVPMGR